MRGGIAWPTSCGSCARAECRAPHPVHQGSADGAALVRYSTRYLTAFFARELLGDARVGPLVDGAGRAGDEAAGLVHSAHK